MDLNLDDFINYEDFLLSFKEYCLFKAFYNSVAATVLRILGAYWKNMKLHHLHDFHHYTNVDRTKEIIKLMEKDKEYGQYVVEYIENMMPFKWKENFVTSNNFLPGLSFNLVCYLWQEFLFFYYL